MTQIPSLPVSKRRGFLAHTGHILIGSTGLLSAALSVQAAKSSIRLVVPYSAGGDALVRVFADALSAALAQTVFVENAPGANSMIGLQKVARAPGDGLTIGVVTDSLPILQAYKNELALEVSKGLRPIARISQGALVLVVSAEAGVRTLDEFSAKARTAPDKVTFGSPGIASPQFIAMSLLAKRLNVKLLHVPFAGTGPVLNEIAAGRVDAGFMSLGAARPLLTSGRVLPIAVSGSVRVPLIPEVPTVSELISHDFDILALQGLVGPASLSLEAASALARGAESAMLAAKSRFDEVGYVAAPLNPQGFAKFLTAETTRYSKVLAEAQLTSG